ncbi:MAG: carbohydrate kinase family protein [Lachnospiraceae bacterium]|nr:carbohydrate kinase family protein [Lachnospiraceae bacterium]
MNVEPEIIVIGAAILDVLARPVSSDVFETGSLPMESITLSVGGDAANEAAVLSWLGKKVQLETVIGMDRAGQFLKEYFAEKQILLQDRVWQKDLRTGINVVLVDAQGDRHFLTDPGASLRALAPEHIDRHFPACAKIVCFASIFVFPKMGKEELLQLFTEIKKQGKLLCADLTKRKNQETLEEMKEVFALVDYLFPNDEEAMLLSGTDSVEAAADAFFRAGCAHVILKCGSRGCYIRSEEYTGYLAPEHVYVPVDTTGAGDSFAAGFLAGLAEGRTLLECAALGNVCGGRAVQVPGATEWLQFPSKQQ